MPNNLSVIILTYNNQDTLVKTLESIAWADEIVLIDQGSTDQTLKLAEKYSPKVYPETSADFSLRRNLGKAKVTNPWILYLDADEIISPKLRQEILAVISSHSTGVYSLKRVNYFLGTKMYPDTVTRLFHQSSLDRWEGAVHESPIYSGSAGFLKHPLIHHTHRSISTMLAKTNQWSAIQAQLLFAAHHPKVKVWRIFRIALTECYRQFIVLRIGRYGLSGWIEGIFQVIDKMIVYIKLWELQQA